MSLTGLIGSTELWVFYLDFAIRIIGACFCGALIGFERSKRFKEAGIRTHILVCVAASLMMIVSKYGFPSNDIGELTNYFVVRSQADPARIAAQVVSGVSFLCAGVIFKNGNTIKGLTTAAGIWATAGIGLAIGAGMYFIALFVTIIIVGLQFLMHKITVGGDAMATNRLSFTVKNTENFQTQYAEYLRKNKAVIIKSRVTYNDDGTISYDVTVRAPKGIGLDDFTSFLTTITEVKSIGFSPED